MSIQILGLRLVSYRDQVSGELKEHISDNVFFNRRWRADTVEELFEFPEKILAQIPVEEHWNLYYTACHCTHKKREMAYQTIIPFDIDGISVERVDEYVDPVITALGIDKNKTGILYTGNGLQFIVRLLDDQLIKADSYFEEYKLQYKAVCDKINKNLEEKRLPGAADLAVFTKSRILRLPRTINRKPGKPERTGRILQGKILPQSFDLVKLSGITKVEPSDAISDGEFRKMRRVSGEIALQECDFLRFAKENPNKINEPQWYGMLSIVGRFENGEQLVHDLSQGHKGYSHSDTSKKLEHALAASGPRTCKNINSLWGKCKDCKHFEKVKSPIAIVDPNVIGTEASGFWTFKDNGEPNNPVFADLLKAFKRDTNYFVDAFRKKIFGFEKTHYRSFSNIDLEAYCERAMNPKPKQLQRREFVAKIWANNVRPTEEIDQLFFETIKGKLNLQNGVLDIKNGVLEPHSEKYGFRYVLPYNFDPNADCPEFKSFLRQVTLDREDLQKTLIEFMGYCLYPEYDDHCFLWLTGDGRNGKSTFMEIVASLCGEYNTSNIFLIQFEKEKYLEMLNNKLLNIAEESDGVRIAGQVLGTLKALSAGGRVMVDQKFEVPYAMRNQTKFIFASNSPPRLASGETAIRSRMIVVPFDLKLENHATGERKIRDGYREVLKAELPGILNLALKGMNEFAARAQRKIFRGQVTVAAFNKLVRDSDPFERWAQDALELRPGNPVSLDELYANYEAEVGPDRATPKHWFTNKLDKKFPAAISFERKTVNNETKRYVIGIALVNAPRLEKHHEKTDF